MLTCPCLLVTDGEAGALWVRAADVGSFYNTVHREHASLMVVGWPALVLLISRCTHAFQHSIVYAEERKTMSVFKLGKTWWVYIKSADTSHFHALSKRCQSVVLLKDIPLTSYETWVNMRRNKIYVRMCVTEMETNTTQGALYHRQCDKKNLLNKLHKHSKCVEILYESCWKLVRT